MRGLIDRFHIPSLRGEPLFDSPDPGRQPVGCLLEFPYETCSLVGPDVVAVAHTMRHDPLSFQESHQFLTILHPFHPLKIVVRRIESEHIVQGSNVAMDLRFLGFSLPVLSCFDVSWNRYHREETQDDQDRKDLEQAGSPVSLSTACTTILILLLPLFALGPRIREYSVTIFSLRLDPWMLGGHSVRSYDAGGRSKMQDSSS